MNAVNISQSRPAGPLAVNVRARQVVVLLGVAIAAAWMMLLGAPAPSASAQPCPDVEVIFARGTGESPGVGGVGQAFVDSLRSQVGGRSVGVYGVNYPASGDFEAGVDFAKTVVDGIRDEVAHVESMAANCPNTKGVLGGYSQGAVVTGFVTSDAVPAGVPAASVPEPMSPKVADHIAAVVLLGKPSDEFMRHYGAPAIAIGPLYSPKTIELCAPGDTICSGAPDGGPNVAHVLYPVNGMVGQSAAFAASRL